METWVLEFKKKLREELGAGIEIKKLGNSFYVYRSTTYWDKENKIRRKKSKYLGSLDKEKGLVKSSGKILTHFTPKTVRKYGDVQLFYKVTEDLMPLLKKDFPHIWQEIFALAIVRFLKQAPLKRVSSVWNGLHNNMKITPRISPKILSTILKEIGEDRSSQNIFFKKLMDDNDVFAYDLSVIFTRSEGINFAEKGYNRYHLYLPQINLVLLTSTDEELPSAIKIVPGSVRDISSLYVTLEELTLKNKTLILDRGFFSDDLMKKLQRKGVSYVIPARRNSVLYKDKVNIDEHFFYKKRLIKCGKKKINDYFIYLFEDTMLKMEEERRFFRMIDDGLKKKTELNAAKFGKILIVSNIDDKPEEIFQLYKQRDEVEKSFDVFKNLLEADRLYLRNNESVFGHIFVSFISLYAYCKIRALLKKAKLLEKYSVEDVIEIFGKVYVIQDGDREIISEIPKKVRIFDEKLKTDLFPK